MKFLDLWSNSLLGVGFTALPGVLKVFLMLVRSWPKIKKTFAPIVKESTLQPARWFATTMIALSLAFGMVLLMAVKVEDEFYRIVAMGIAASLLAAEGLQTILLPFHQGLREQNERLEKTVAVQAQLFEEKVATLEDRKERAQKRLEKMLEKYAFQVQLLEQKVAVLEAKQQSAQKQLPPSRKPLVTRTQRQKTEVRCKTAERKKKTKGE